MKNKKTSSYEIREGKLVRIGEDTNNEPEIKAERNEIESADSEAAFERFRQRREDRIVRKKVLRTAAVLSFLLLTVAVLFMFSTRISEITVTGSEKYTSRELEEAISHLTGKNYFFLGKDNIANELYAKYPLLEDISVSLSVPGKVRIEVKDGEAKYFTVLDGEYLCLTDELRVAGVQSERPDNMTELIKGGISSALIGETLEFSTDTDYTYITGIIKVLSEHSISEHIVRIDMTEKFNVKLKYKDRFIILIGNSDELNTRLTLCEEYVKTIADGKRGIIDATDTSIGSFREQESID